MPSPLRTLHPLRPFLHHPLTPSMIRTPLQRTFRSSTPHLADATTTTTTAAPVAVPVKKPVGAFRSGMFGFLLGSTLAGAGTWFYIMEEYRVSNELLTEDIYALQAAVQRIHTLALALEERLTLAEMKGGGKK